jgi:hypothetical protein
MGTDPDAAALGCAGATRFSFGPFLTEDQTRFAGESVRTIAVELARSEAGSAPTGVR